MQRNLTIGYYAVGIIFAILIGSFVGWYLFIKSATDKIDTISAGRGLVSSLNSPSTPGGNTVTNIGSTLQTFGDQNTSFDGGAGANADGTGLLITSLYAKKDQRISGSGSGTNGDANANAATAVKTAPQIFRPEKAPVAGYGFAVRDGITELQYVERATGYVNAVNLLSGEVTRLTNTLQPKILNAEIALDGTIYQQYQNNSEAIITTQTLPTEASSTPYALVATILPESIADISVSGTGNSAAYVAENPNGVIVTSGLSDFSKSKQLLETPIRAWQIAALADKRTILTTNAADGEEGVSFVFDAKGNRSVLKEGRGLLVLPQSSSTALFYSLSENGLLQTFIRLSANTSDAPLEMRTLAEKCVWNTKEPIVYCAVPSLIQSGQFLNDWYKGLTHTDDAWFQVDARIGKETSLEIPMLGGQSLPDVENPKIDPNNNFIAFKNAKDQSLWVVRITK